MAESQVRIRDVTLGMRDKARELRQRQTSAETLLWEELRGRRLDGLKFRRQCALGNYVVDFLFADPRLVIEIDGGHHEKGEQRTYDEDRSRHLESLGYRVARFGNDEVMTDLAGVLESIRRTASR